MDWESHSGSAEPVGIRRIVASGSGRRVISDLDESCVSATCSGSASLVMCGRAETIDLHVSGSCWVDAHDVQSRSARVNVSGSAVVLVRADSLLEIHASGSARVQTFGTAKLLIKHRGGSAEIICAPA